MDRFVLRPYRTSTTYREPEGAGRRGLPRHRRRPAAGPGGDRRPVDPEPDPRPAGVVAGWILDGACRYYEFRVVELDDRDDRTTIAVETVAEGRLPRLLRLQPRQARGRRGGDPGHPDRLPAPGRDPGRVPEAGRPRREDGRTGRGRGLPPPARARPATPRTTLRPTRPQHAHDAPPHPDPEPAPFRPAGLGAQAPRQFGGVGLMIEAPGLELIAEPAPSGVSQGRWPIGSARLVGQAYRSSGGSIGLIALRVPRLESRSSPRRPSTSAWASEPSSAWPSSGSLLELAGNHDPSLETLADALGARPPLGDRAARLLPRRTDRRRRPAR